MRSAAELAHVKQERWAAVWLLGFMRALIVFALTLAACAHTPHGARYALLSGSNSTALARSDSNQSCPPRGDTLWATNAEALIPRHWLEASITHGCAYGHLPRSVWRRLRVDRASLAFYADVVRGIRPASEHARTWALRYLSWSGDRKYRPLILDAARSGVPGLVPVPEALPLPGGMPARDYNVPYRALLELGLFLFESEEARTIVLQAARNDTSEYTRRAAILALARANTPWARQILRETALEALDEYTRARVARALAHLACERGTVFVESYGVEGQDYSKCQRPREYP